VAVFYLALQIYALAEGRSNDPERGGESRHVKSVPVVIVTPYPFSKGRGRIERSGKKKNRGSHTR
jgi:hypothetical protein